VPDRRVVIVVYPGCQALDLAGPHEVLAGANELLDARHRADPRYRLLIAAAQPGPVRTESGLTIVADQALARVRGPVDTLLVVGGSGVYALEPGGELIADIRRLAGPARRVASVCTGAFALAAAGLLDDRTGLHALGAWRAARPRASRARRRSRRSASP
jgi:transcriptional regulator GlxA family with amidase domain